MARPLRLDSIIGTTTTGEPVTVEQRILGLLRNGERRETAVARAGISRGTFHRWIREGARLEEALLINPRKHLTRNDQRLLEFSRAVDRALADGESRWRSNITKLAEGNLETTTITEKVVIEPDPTDPTRTRERVVERTVRRERNLPSLAANVWMMEAVYGLRRGVTVHHEGGDGALSEDERAGEWVDTIEDWLAARRGQEA